MFADEEAALRKKGDRMSKIAKDDIEEINELQWFDFEIRMRKVIQEFLEPTIERISKSKE